MITTNHVNALLDRLPITETVSVMQADTYSRNIAFHLYSNNMPATCPETTKAIVRYLKPDGTGGNYDTLPDGSAACAITDNILTVALAPQVCTVPGIVRLTAALIDGEAELHVFTVHVNVCKNPGLQATSESYYNVRGSLADAGWPANMLLGTDAYGNVIAVAIPKSGVQTVNGIGPDADGNVIIDISGLAGWKNLKDLTGKYTRRGYHGQYVSDSETTYIEFGPGEYPLHWICDHEYAANNDDIVMLASASFYLDLHAGEDVRFEVRFPRDVRTGVDCGPPYVDYYFSNPTGIGINPSFEVICYPDGSEPPRVAADTLFESYTLEHTLGEDGLPVGFVLSGTLAGDLTRLQMSCKAGDIATEKPFTCTQEVIHQSYDDIRYKAGTVEGDPVDETTLAAAKEYADAKAARLVSETVETLTLTNGAKVPAPFTQLVGLEIVDRAGGRRLLTAPQERFDGGQATLYSCDSTNFGDAPISIVYGTFNDYLDKPCLIFSGDGLVTHCPSLFYAPDGYDYLAYAYEETHDTLGFGVTMTPGWYVLNGATFEVLPADMTQNPFVITTALLDEFGAAEARDYLDTMFPLAEEITYTVTEENIFNGVWVSPAKVSHIGIDAKEWTGFGLYNVASFMLSNGYVDTNFGFFGYADRPVSVTYPQTAVQGIPVLDGLILSGADGKRYKLAVDATGALTVSAVE